MINTEMTIDTQMRILELEKKYNKYNYLLSSNSSELTSSLIDAILSGSKYISTFNTYTKEIENDIYDIINLIPNILQCTLGTLRCRDNMTALHLACVNPNIPIKIIKYMIFKGADLNQTYFLNNKKINIIDDIEDHMSDDAITEKRLKNLKNLNNPLNGHLKIKLEKGPLFHYINNETFTDLIINNEYNNFLDNLNMCEIGKHLKRK